MSNPLLVKVLKYLIEGGAVALAAFVIPGRSLKLEEILMVSLTAASTFIVLDTFSPSIASGARKGSGFAIGSNLAGYKLNSGLFNSSTPTPTPTPTS